LVSNGKKFYYLIFILLTIVTPWLIHKFDYGVLVEDEPDDGDFEDLEENLDDQQTTVKLPEKGKPTGLTRVVKNENLSTFVASDSSDGEAMDV